jgi:hypothetical protein
MSVEVPRSLRAVVRARRAGWRLRIAHVGGLGVRVLMMVIAVVLVAAGVVLIEIVCAAAIFGVIVAFVGENVAPLGVIAFFLMLPLLFLVGLWMVVGARALLAVARRVAAGFRRVDIQPTRFVAAGRVRSVVEVADLTRVIVRHREPEVELVLRAGATTLVCPATAAGPLRRVDPNVLADWLAEVLTPLEIPVCGYRATLPLPVDATWLPADTVADIWQVSVADVPVLADRCGVHTASGQPMFNAYDVEASTERAQAIYLHG